jgi:hypothetical protein
VSHVTRLTDEAIDAIELLRPGWAKMSFEEIIEVATKIVRVQTPPPEDPEASIAILAVLIGQREGYSEDEYIAARKAAQGHPVVDSKP